MALTELRLDQAARALASLESALALPSSDLQRDASIQRFEHTFEAVWKYAKHFLAEAEGVEAVSPKSVIRACFGAGLLTEQQSREALLMVDDRNVISHTYNEKLAVDLYSRLRAHAELLGVWLAAMRRTPT